MTDSEERQNLMRLKQRSVETIRHAESTIRQARGDLWRYEEKLRRLDKKLIEQEYPQ